MPGASPFVFQSNVAVEEYACPTVQLLDEPGARVQNWYCGLGQPPDVAEMWTVVPDSCGDPGVMLMFALVQRQYAVNVSCPSGLVAVTVNV